MIQGVAVVMSMTLAQVPTPADVMRQAHADMAKVEAFSTLRYRYLLRPRRWSDKEWIENANVIVTWVNHLSSSSRLFPLPKIDLGTGKLIGGEEVKFVGNWLLRIDAYEMGPAFLKSWDRLVDPYLRESRVDVTYTPPKVTKDSEWFDWPGGVLPKSKGGDGVSYLAKGTYRIKGKVETPAKEEVRAVHNQASVFLLDKPGDEKLWDDLRKWTYSDAPIVRADWFCNQTFFSLNRDPGYPEFVGYKDETEWQKINAIDFKLIRAFKLEARDAVTFSDVTEHPRGIVFWPVVRTWKTLDFKNPKDITQDPAETIGPDIEKTFDATEQYAFAPNDLFRVAAFDNKGVLQRKVPDDVATDRHSKSIRGNFRIEPGFKCMSCHKEGLRPLKAFHRELLATPLKSSFRAQAEKNAGRPLSREELEKLARELRDQYLSDLQGALDADVQRYTLALKKVSGLTPAAYSEGLDRIAWDYENAKVDRAWIAKDLGMTDAELLRRLTVLMAAAEVPENRLAIRQKIAGLRYNTITMTIQDYERTAVELWNYVRSVPSEKK